MFSLTPAKEQLREILYTGSVAGAKAPTFFMYQIILGGNRMTKTELIQKFINGAEKGKGSNLYIRGNHLINYNTVIASRDGEKIILNAKKYSSTTSRNQNIVRKLTPKDLLIEVMVA